jgi:branched-chain amino acid transport system ATP-binding protein
MTAPKILLLDEPTAGLAPIAVDKVMKKIESIEESGVSVLMIEQNARKALQVCDYAYVMLSGRILKEGDGLSIQRDENLGRMLLGVR